MKFIKAGKVFESLDMPLVPDTGLYWMSKRTVSKRIELKDYAGYLNGEKSKNDVVIAKISSCLPVKTLLGIFNDAMLFRKLSRIVLDHIEREYTLISDGIGNKDLLHMESWEISL